MSTSVGIVHVVATLDRWEYACRYWGRLCIRKNGEEHLRPLCL